MDIRKLHEPYKDQDSPSPELQVRWLKRLGFEGHVIDQAMLNTYTDIERGIKTFKNGAELNAYIRDQAVQTRNEELSAYITKLEQFEAKLKAKWEAERNARLALAAKLEAERVAKAAKLEEEKLAKERELADTAAVKKPWYKRVFAKEVTE